MTFTFQDLENTPVFQEAYAGVTEFMEDILEEVFWKRRVLQEIFKTQCYILAIGEKIMSEQSQIDSITAQLTAISTGLSTGLTNLQAEIATLQADNPAGNFTAVNAILAQLTTVATAVDALAPTAPVAAVQAFDPGSTPANLPLYSFAGTGSTVIDTTQWVAATDVTGPSGETLYTNVNDTPNAAPTQVVVGTWLAYTGAITTV